LNIWLYKKVIKFYNVAEFHKINASIALKNCTYGFISTLEINLLCLRLSFFLLLLILHLLYIAHTCFYCLYYSFLSVFLIWVRRQLCTSTLIQEELREVIEPLIENSASFLVFELTVLIVILNCCIFTFWLAITYSLPSRWFSIGIRAWTLPFGFNNLR